VSDPLAAVLNEPIVSALASPPSFERGIGYFEEGRVGPLRVTAGHVAANVQGTETYVVELSAAAGRLRFACSCPIGVDETFCKHCVAVALTWLHDQGGSIPTLDDARRHLETLPPESLVELLVDHAQDDEQLARKLMLMASRPARGTSADRTALSAVVDRAFAHHGFVSYRDMWDYVRGIDETIDVLEDQLTGGRTGEVVDLAEYALAAAERALDHVDDSSGQMRGVIERLKELHIDACRRAGPDPVALAERLFTRELEGQWDVFDRAVVRYADVLGDTGLTRYRELAEERWANVPALAPGEDSVERYGTRFRITRSWRRSPSCPGASRSRSPGQWAERREAALTLLRDREPDRRAAARPPSLRGRGFSELVWVFLWEGDPDAAWQAANEGGCTPDLRLELADRRRAEHPGDALNVYRRHVEDVIARKDKRAYREAVRLIDETMRELFAEDGRPEGFSAYVEEVRTGHKAKRNLMKLMDELTPAGRP